MRYENKQAPEGINVSKVHPLKQFAILVIASVALLLALVLVLQFAGSAVAKRIPFKYEVQLSQKFDIALSTPDAPEEIVTYLNDLADRLAPGLDLIDDFDVQVHYREEDVFNAFATLGGNLLFYRELLRQMPHENALAMVMAHEMAHINHRDPISGLGGGVVSAIGVAMVTGRSGMAEQAFSQTSLLAGMQFTRQMESAADTAALSAVNQLYGHVNGAGVLFELIGDIKADSDAVPDWLERISVTHPLSKDRVAAIKSLALHNGWSEMGELTKLPDAFNDWLRQ